MLLFLRHPFTHPTSTRLARPWRRGAGLLVFGLLLASLTPSSRPAAHPRPHRPATPPPTATDSCWNGYLGGKIPVLVHYQRDGDVLAGEITYLNTKAKTPIRLLGTVEADHTYRLLEFGKDGTITGVLVGRPAGGAFTGQWYSPATGRELALRLTRKEARVASVPLRADAARLAGDYFYRYGPEGGQGSFTLTRLAAGRASFELLGVTGTPAHNIADVPLDTIPLTGTAFTYALPDAPDCAFRVRFYRDFLVVSYTKGPCLDQFGHNATAEGVFLKIK